MWTRVLTLALLLLMAPLTAWSAVHCCEPADACCSEELPTCPVSADGECTLADAAPEPAAMSVAPGRPILAALPSVAPRTSPDHGALGAANAPPRSGDHPRYLELRNLRI